MKKICILFTVVALALPSCEKQTVQPYAGSNAVYFQVQEKLTDLHDTITYSFAKHEATSREIMVRVNLQGIPKNHDRRFILKFSPEHTTAVEGEDFEPLAAEYVIAANEYYAQVPITINRTQPLKTQYRYIHLYLEATEDLIVGLSDRQRAVIKFTDRIIKPVYWDDVAHYLWGTWSQVKQFTAENILGWEFPETRDEYYANPFYNRMAAGSNYMNQYFNDNVVVDENNDRIMPWK